MFPDRIWSLDWLADRFSRHSLGPHPSRIRCAMARALYDIVQTEDVHSNGPNDDWTVSGIAYNLSHHSDLSRAVPTATHDT
jgi:hypothetical protein